MVREIYTENRLVRETLKGCLWLEGKVLGRKVVEKIVQTENTTIEL